MEWAILIGVVVFLAVYSMMSSFQRNEKEEIKKYMQEDKEDVERKS